MLFLLTTPLICILGDGGNSDVSVDAKSIMLFNLIKSVTAYPLVDLVHKIFTSILTF
jgi:hypothetical protein